LRLGGDSDSSFDASAIGAAAQYRNFDIFQKIGTSTWTLTGASSDMTAWQLQGGTLSVSSDGNLGGAAGALTFSGGTLRNTAAFTSTRAAILNGADARFQSDADLTWSGMISGTGALVKTGNGALILSANNAYTGATNVNAGTLRVNGNHSAVTGLTSVASGATLGGSGTIGGAVTVADGGHIAPGNSPGTLNMGTLTLNAGSVLDFELGEANVAGGTLNDLINVNGDLTLDGTLNVSPSAGGTYGAGIYRLINYTGTFTDNGLALGLLPAGSNNYIQTSIANQVNLINTQDLILSYWDGPTDARNNGAIGGGSGTWRASSDENWTAADGSFNAPHRDSTMAVFTGAAGTVTVDTSLGTVRIAGMQFASDGYRIEGDAITLADGLNTVRVGDGSGAGAAYTAVIASEITGDGRLVKTDLGTLVLTATNTYTGGTTISAGTLALSGAGSLGSATELVADGTLDISAANTDTSIANLTGTGSVVLGARALTLTAANGSFGVVDGAAGTLNKGGAGTWSLTGAGSQADTLNVQAGTLELASGASLGSQTTTIAAGASLRNGGTFVGTAGNDALALAGTFVGSASFLDGNDQVQIAEGANFSQAAFDGGAGVDTLDITSSTTLTLSPTLATGFENLVKRGAGALTLNGAVDGFSESITLAGGTAQLANANIVTNQMNIQSGVTVTGTGSLSGGLMNAGVLSPGNSPGTIHIGGNYVQAASGTLISQITRSGTDRLEVAGNAVLAGTHQIQVEYGLYLDGTTHTLIHAAGGISGTFEPVQLNPSALMSADHEIGATSETVSFTRQATTTITDPDTNQGRFAQWLDERIAAGGLTPEMTSYIDTLLQQPTAEQAKSLLGQVAEPPAAISQGSVSTLGAGYARTVFDRFALGDGVQCGPAQASSDVVNCSWMQGLRQWGDADGDRFGPSYDWTTDGGQLGFDRRLFSWTVGATFGYAQTDLADAQGATNALRSKMGGVYASYAAGPIGFDALTFYSSNDNRTQRSVLFGSESQAARASFDSDSYGVGARISYRLTEETRALVRPFAELFYDRIEGARFAERDAGAGNLAVRIHDREGLRGTAGLQLAEQYEGHGHVFRPALEIGVAHQFEDTQSTLDVQPFSGGEFFRAQSVALDRTSYVAKASLGISLGKNAGLTLGYSGELADDHSHHEASLGVRIAW
jgi:autotransporter-associated beta strand protein